MKKKYSQIFYSSLFLLLFPINHINAQTTLVAGDIAFTGYNSDNSTGLDTFSFVITRVGGISSATTISFTDNGWLSGTSALATNEGVITWTSSNSISQGTEVKIAGLVALINGATSGSVANTSNAASGLSLSSTGDQVLAFQGASLSPTFISAIQMNVSTLAGDGIDSDSLNWDGSVIGTNRSAKPPGLITGRNAVWLPVETDNAKYSCTGSTGSLANVIIAINNSGNWLKDDLNPYVLPSGCFNGSIVPVQLISFESRRTETGVVLNWKTASEINTGYFVVERSYNEEDFDMLGKINPIPFSSGVRAYEFTDKQVSASINTYYRLKIVDLDGTEQYSPVIRSSDEKIQQAEFDIFPNPSVDKINIIRIPNANMIIISDLTGRIVHRQNITESISNTVVDIAFLKPGIYLLSMSDSKDTRTFPSKFFIKN